MQTINYKEEVLKVYPDAEISWYYDDEIEDIIIWGVCGIYTDGDFGNEDEAWEYVYNTHIKNQNK